MVALEQLTFNGAMTLLTYLQYGCLEQEHLGAAAIAGTLCEMLSQLEVEFPGVTEQYGWTKAIAPLDKTFYGRAYIDCCQTGISIQNSVP